MLIHQNTYTSKKYTIYENLIHFKTIPGPGVLPAASACTETRIETQLRQIHDDFVHGLAPAKSLALLSRPEVFKLMLAPNFSEQQELVNLLTEALGYVSFATTSTIFEREFSNLRGMINLIYQSTTVVQLGPEAHLLTIDLSNNMQMPKEYIIDRLNSITRRLMESYRSESTSNRVSWLFCDESAGQTREVEFVPDDYNDLSALLRLCYEVRCLLLHGHADRSLAANRYPTNPTLLARDKFAITTLNTRVAQADIGATAQTQATAGDSAQAVAPGTGDGATGSNEAGNARDSFEIDSVSQMLIVELQNIHQRAIAEARIPTNSLFANNFVGLYEFIFRALITIIKAILFDAFCPVDRLDGTFMEAEVVLLLNILGGVNERGFWRKQPPPP